MQFLILSLGFVLFTGVIIFPIPSQAQAISTDNPVALSSAIKAAYARGDKKIIIPAGSYRFPTLTPDSNRLWFEQMKNFEIDATGVTLLFSNPDQGGIAFHNCENVTFRGATLIQDPMPFSQGRIVSIAPDRNSLQIQVTKGYPTQYVPKMFDVFDPVTRQWKPGTRDIWGTAIQQVSPGLFNIQYSLGTLPIVVGDLAAWRGSVISNAVYFGNCGRMKLLDATIENGGCFGAFENGGDGGNFYRYKVTYGPPPAGADEPPLMSENADAFHSRCMRKGPELDHCFFEGMNDDGIPIHGFYATVVESSGTRLVIDYHFDDFCRRGDSLRFLNNQSALAAEAKAVSFAPLPQYVPAQTGSPAEKSQFSEAKKYYEVILDHPVAAFPGWFVSDSDERGNGFIIRHCTVRNNRARGILIKADNGLIEDCTVEGSTMAGIVIAPEGGYWGESDYSRNVILRGNTIRDVGYWDLNDSKMAGALSIGAYEHDGYVPLPGSHRHIIIDGNTFLDNDGVNLLISSAEDVTISNNHFIRPMAAPTQRGQAPEPDINALIWLTECTDIHLKNNTVIDPGNQLHALLVHTATASGTGFTTGVVVKKVDK